MGGRGGGNRIKFKKKERNKSQSLVLTRQRKCLCGREGSFFLFRGDGWDGDWGMVVPGALPVAQENAGSEASGLRCLYSTSAP